MELDEPRKLAMIQKMVHKRRPRSLRRLMVGGWWGVSKKQLWGQSQRNSVEFKTPKSTKTSRPEGAFTWPICSRSLNNWGVLWVQVRVLNQSSRNLFKLKYNPPNKRNALNFPFDRLQPHLYTSNSQLTLCSSPFRFLGTQWTSLIVLATSFGLLTWTKSRETLLLQRNPTNTLTLLLFSVVSPFHAWFLWFWNSPESQGQKYDFETHRNLIPELAKRQHNELCDFLDDFYSGRISPTLTTYKRQKPFVLEFQERNYFWTTYKEAERHRQGETEEHFQSEGTASLHLEPV